MGEHYREAIDYLNSGPPEVRGRRVSACVEACENIPTAELESGVIAELVAACDRMLAETDTGLSPSNGALDRIRTALAGMKGEPHGT